MFSDTANSYFDIAIATIFAREFLEGSIIIGQYRTIIHKSDHWESPEQKNQALREVTKSVALAALVAVLLVIAVATPLGFLSETLEEHVVSVVEGVSKVVAAVAIMQLSIKIPVWLGLYEKVPILPCRKNVPHFANHSMDNVDEAKDLGLTLKEIRFNVAWNIWREVAETGAFMVPFFLSNSAKAIPLSALAGILIAMFFGGLIYIAGQCMESKLFVAMFMSLVTGMFSVGLFVGGCHEFEEVWGSTHLVWEIKNPNMSSDSFPMVLFKPFGYSSSRTVLQIICFWSWSLIAIALHCAKYGASMKYREAHNAAIETARVKETETSDLEERVSTRAQECNDCSVDEFEVVI